VQNDEGNNYTEDYNDEPMEDCMRCGTMILPHLMGVHCDACDMYFHKSCSGQCDCVDSMDHIDLTMINSDDGSDDDTESDNDTGPGQYL
jgi:hypothetical protein